MEITITEAGFFGEDGEWIVEDVALEPNSEEEETGEDKEIEPGKIDGSDLIQAYFNSLGNIPILLREEEYTLMEQIEKGSEFIKEVVTDLTLYRDLLEKEVDTDLEPEEKEKKATGKILEIIDLMAKAVCGQDVIRPEQIEAELGMRTGDYERILKVLHLVGEAKDEMINHNLRLVISIAKSHIGRGIPLIDLIQEGNIGLMKAVDKFDYKRGFKFGTYATWWIRQAVTRAIYDQARTIRVPVHMIEFYNRVMGVSKKLVQELGREPSADEIAQKIGLPVERIREVLKWMQRDVSLSSELGNTTLENFVSDGNIVSPCKNIERAKTSKEISELLSTLTPKEEEIIRMRFGIGFDREYTLQEVGDHFSITRERIRQIEAKALRKLRRPSRSAEFAAGREGNKKKALPKRKKKKEKKTEIIVRHSQKDLELLSNQELLDLFKASI